MDRSAPHPLAVVTGASSGIGLELAKVFAEHGYDLLVTAEDPGIAAAADAVRALGAHVESVQADLATYDGVEQLYARIRAAGRPVEALALNAGVGVGGAFTGTELRAELNLINLNVVSVVHLAKRIVPDMLARGAGKILFTSSIAAEMPAPYLSTYAASKAFLFSFAEGLRVELKDAGVTVTALLPGPTDTNFFARADMEDTKIAQMKKDDPREVARDGFKALMAGKDHIVAGSLKNKAQVAAAQVMADKAVAAIQGRMTKPGSGG